MQYIDEDVLENDFGARYQYLAEFIGFGDDDVKAIHGSVAYMVPLIPQIVDQTYERLLAYDATARHFMPRQHGYDGPTPESLAELSKDHPQIQFRKDHLNRYLMHLIGHAYNEKMAAYLDMAGKMHTPKAGSANIDVPLVQMNALMGLLSDCLMKAIWSFPVDEDQRMTILRSFNKLLWIQNDLINRHY